MKFINGIKIFSGIGFKNLILDANYVGGGLKSKFMNSYHLCNDEVL